MSKICPPGRLKEILSGRKNRKVVFTNGCFDIIHKGHVSYLRRARTLGDILVVALDVDESVSNQKGPTRPVNTLKDRMFVISEFECVSYVTWFKNSDPRPLIKQLKPDLLVKGGDWKVAQILGHEEMKTWGGKTRSLKFIDGYSSTNSIAKLIRTS